MQLSILALCTLLCPRVLGHPYVSETTCISATKTSVENLWVVSEPTEVSHIQGKRGYGEILQARDTTATTDSTTSTDTTTDTTTSETSTSITTSTSSTSETSTSTSSTSTTSTSTTSTTSSTTSTSSTTTSSASTTTSTTTATATSSSTAELDEWNRRGNITAIVFGCCMISLFVGISVIYCVRDRARARRIAARKELESSSSDSKIPLVAAKDKAIADIEVNRSSMMFTNQPQTEYFPARSIPSVSNHHSHTTSATSQTATSQTTTSQTTTSTRDHASRAHINEQHTPLV
ncbi:hypothetical protein N7519_003008 [Penicillium mononematosum]|uniref:uncharacterized protein n=1 Tax=Penicillium mononematosum TaxID=268346 RepID=UPI00254981B9|nr:uncharacterized protein N7519_003008 [Penicillium mononematosum]KAJ6188100.1 hypothetical protein N7519_003008 [Penicillium mononematosum]